jgi:hypothetical protein
MSPLTYSSLAKIPEHPKHKQTHEDNLVVHDHRSIATADVRYSLAKRTNWREDGLFFEYRGYISISLADVMLACSEMAIDHADGRVVNGETRYDSTLVKVSTNSSRGTTNMIYFVSVYAAHSSFDRGDGNVLERYALGTLDEHTAK